MGWLNNLFGGKPKEKVPLMQEQGKAKAVKAESKPQTASTPPRAKPVAKATSAKKPTSKKAAPKKAAKKAPAKKKK